MIDTKLTWRAPFAGWYVCGSGPPRLLEAGDQIQIHRISPDVARAITTGDELRPLLLMAKLRDAFLKLGRRMAGRAVKAGREIDAARPHGHIADDLHGDCTLCGESALHSVHDDPADAETVPAGSPGVKWYPAAGVTYTTVLPGMYTIDLPAGATITLPEKGGHE